MLKPQIKKIRRVELDNEPNWNEEHEYKNKQIKKLTLNFHKYRMNFVLWQLEIIFPSWSVGKGEGVILKNNTTK